MSDYPAVERRDPASGLIRLGVALAHIHKEHRSGVLRVEDKGRTHLVRLIEGRIAGVRFAADKGANSDAADRATLTPEHLFSLERPRATFEERYTPVDGAETISPDRVVLHGVVQRREVFDPRPLSERIPVDSVNLEREALCRLLRVGLSDAELEFVDSLRRPTPVTLALWKRGLPPQHAAALLVAMNLVGCFPSWRPGELPRIATVGRVLKKIRSRASHHELLGVAADASREEIDRAFRKLSFALHPDRLSWIPARERQDARDAFDAVSAAHASMRSSRRRPPVRGRRDLDGSPDGASCRAQSWRDPLAAAERFAEAGLHRQAAAAALRALSCAPPPHIAAKLKQLLRACA